jgi:hypothetical protein
LEKSALQAINVCSLRFIATNESVSIGVYLWLKLFAPPVPSNPTVAPISKQLDGKVED